MYNFGDDNTVLHIDEDVNQVVSKVERQVKEFNAIYGLM